LTLVAREEHPEWHSRQRQMFETVIAEDADDAEPGLRSLAAEGRRALPTMDQVRRVLVVAAVD